MATERGPHRQLVLVVEGTAALYPYWSKLLKCIRKTVSAFCGNGKGCKKLSDTSNIEMALVVFYTYGPSAGSAQRSPWTKSLKLFMKWVAEIEFSGVGTGEDVDIVGGLAEALTMCCSGQPATQMTETTQKHCVLVAASNPYHNPQTVISRPPCLTLQNENDGSAAQPWIVDAETVAKAYFQCGVSLSLISPRRLEIHTKIYEQGNNIPPGDYSQHPMPLILLSQRFKDAWSTLSSSGATSSTINLISESAATPSVSVQTSAATVRPSSGQTGDETMVGQHPTSNAVSSAQATNMVPNFPGDEICVEHHPTSKAVSTPPTNMVPLLPGVEMWDDETRDAIFLDKLLDDKMWDDKMWDGKMFDDTLPFDKLWGEDAVPPETTNMVPLLAGDETMVEHHPTPSAVFGAVTMNMEVPTSISVTSAPPLSITTPAPLLHGTAQAVSGPFSSSPAHSIGEKGPNISAATTSTEVPTSISVTSAPPLSITTPAPLLHGTAQTVSGPFSSSPAHSIAEKEPSVSSSPANSKGKKRSSVSSSPANSKGKKRSSVPSSLANSRGRKRSNLQLSSTAIGGHILAGLGQSVAGGGLKEPPGGQCEIGRRHNALTGIGLVGENYFGAGTSAPGNLQCEIGKRHNALTGIELVGANYFGAGTSAPGNLQCEIGRRHNALTGIGPVGARYFGAGTSAPGNLQLPPTATAAQQPGLIEEDLQILWQGIIGAMNRDTFIHICTLQAFCRETSSCNIVADWPNTMVIKTLISRGDANRKYQGLAKLFTFRAMEPNTFFDKLEEKKHWAVIELPTQTLLLSGLKKPHKLLGLVFSPGRDVSWPQLPSQLQLQPIQPHLQQQKQQPNQPHMQQLLEWQHQEAQGPPQPHLQHQERQQQQPQGLSQPHLQQQERQHQQSQGLPQPHLQQQKQWQQQQHQQLQGLPQKQQQQQQERQYQQSQGLPQPLLQQLWQQQQQQEQQDQQSQGLPQPHLQQQKQWQQQQHQQLQGLPQKQQQQQQERQYQQSQGLPQPLLQQLWQQQQQQDQQDQQPQGLPSTLAQIQLPDQTIAQPQLTRLRGTQKQRQKKDPQPQGMPPEVELEFVQCEFPNQSRPQKDQKPQGMFSAAEGAVAQSGLPTQSRPRLMARSQQQPQHQQQNLQPLGMHLASGQPFPQSQFPNQTITQPISGGQQQHQQQNPQPQGTHLARGQPFSQSQFPNQTITQPISGGQQQRPHQLQNLHPHRMQTISGGQQKHPQGMQPISGGQPKQQQNPQPQGMQPISGGQQRQNLQPQGMPLASGQPLPHTQFPNQTITQPISAGQQQPQGMPSAIGQAFPQTQRPNQSRTQFMSHGQSQGPCPPSMEQFMQHVQSQGQGPSPLSREQLMQHVQSQVQGPHGQSQGEDPPSRKQFMPHVQSQGQGPPSMEQFMQHVQSQGQGPHGQSQGEGPPSRQHFMPHAQSQGQGPPSMPGAGYQS